MKWMTRQNTCIGLLRAVSAGIAMCCLAVTITVATDAADDTDADDSVRRLQSQAVAQRSASWGHWGSSPEKYSSWTNHSNRLVPVYSFGVALSEYKGAKSLYRSEERLRKIYGRLPEQTLNNSADYFDQTDIYRLQQQAIAAGKKHIVLVVFDGMDWQTTWAAAIHKTGEVKYRHGRGTGLTFQDYRGTTTDFGWCVTSPYSSGASFDVNRQIVTDARGTQRVGYDVERGGPEPWSRPSDLDYLLGKGRETGHAVTDSASSGTSLTAGIKTFNGAINIDPEGNQVIPIGRQLQSKHNFAVGVVTSVPISHATPASAYSNNVNRNDYQDMTRDLIGRRSASHREKPLRGVDVLLGAGWGEETSQDAKQGDNFVPGNKFLADEDLHAIDRNHGGPYVVATRVKGQRGRDVLVKAADKAVATSSRLFGFFGVAGGHLPFQTADGKFNPTIGVKKGERYTQEDIDENPSLADMTRAALQVLSYNDRSFWLMVEAGDVDWANHNNNIDNSIGAVFSGDAAVKAVFDWVEANDCWDETAVIVTADHGHFFVLTDPEILTR